MADRELRVQLGRLCIRFSVADLYVFGSRAEEVAGPR